MTEHDTRALLAEALDFLNDHPRFSLRRNRRRNSYDLAARIDAHLEAWNTPPHPAIAVARDLWNTGGILRIDAEERIVEPTEGGYWIRCWTHIAHASIGEVDDALRARYEQAVAELPELQRAIFLAHLRENLAFADIGSRHGISVSDVRKHLAEALFHIGKALDFN